MCEHGWDGTISLVNLEMHMDIIQPSPTFSGMTVLLALLLVLACVLSIVLGTRQSASMSTTNVEQQIPQQQTGELK